MTAAHEIAFQLNTLFTDRQIKASILVINPECVQIDFITFAGMPLAWLTGPVQAAGWHLSIDKSVDGTYSMTIEPMVQHPQKPPRLLFHATLKANLSSIRADGIVPRAQTVTWTMRSYPTPRSFYAGSKWDAFVYLASHVSGAPVMHGLPSLPKGELEKWELLALTEVSAHRFYRDPIMLPALWTDTVVSPTSLARVKGWRREYRQGAQWGAGSLLPL